MPSPLIPPIYQQFDNNGLPLAGGRLYTYVAGTTTPLATYTDSTLGVANANPVVLDAQGRANVWLGASLYKFVQKTSADVTLWTVDNVSQSGVSTNVTNLCCDADSTTISLASNTTTIVPANIAPIGDAYSEWTTATARFTPAAAGDYLLHFGCSISQNGANITQNSQFLAWVYKNGAQHKYAAFLSWLPATGAGTYVVPFNGPPVPVTLAAGDYADIRVVTPVFTTANILLYAASVSVRRIN
jgi:hypothetical protein